MVRLKPNALDLGTDDVLLASKLLEEEILGVGFRASSFGVQGFRVLGLRDFVFRVLGFRVDVSFGGLV